MEENKIKKSGSQIQHELQCEHGQNSLHANMFLFRTLLPSLKGSDAEKKSEASKPRPKSTPKAKQRAGGK